MTHRRLRNRPDPAQPSWSGEPCSQHGVVPGTHIHRAPGGGGELPAWGGAFQFMVRFIPPPRWPDLVAFVGRRGGERVGLCGQRAYSDMERSQGEVTEAGGSPVERETSTWAARSGREPQVMG